MTKTYLILAGVIFITFIAFMQVRYMKKRKILMSEHEKKLENDFDAVEISKKIEIPFLGSMHYLLVDDVSKKFSYDGSTYNYNDLLEFEYMEDGETIVSGRSLQTVAGGLMFGGLGALAGASGKRKARKKIKKAYINVRVNDLKNGSFQIPIELIKLKLNDTYVEGILSTLTYIKNNK